MSGFSKHRRAQILPCIMNPNYITTNCHIRTIDRGPSITLARTSLTGPRPVAPPVDTAGFLDSDGNPGVDVGVTTKTVGAGGDSAAE